MFVVVLDLKGPTVVSIVATPAAGTVTTGPISFVVTFSEVVQRSTVLPTLSYTVGVAGDCSVGAAAPAREQLRMTIQPVPLWTGRTKLPVNVAPA